MEESLINILQLSEEAQTLLKKAKTEGKWDIRRLYNKKMGIYLIRINNKEMIPSNADPTEDAIAEKRYLKALDDLVKKGLVEIVEATEYHDRSFRAFKVTPYGQEIANSI
jgi:hypothetical protein